MYDFSYIAYHSNEVIQLEVKKENTTLSVGQLTSKFQVTIPKAVRNCLNLKERDKIAFTINDRQEIIIQKSVSI